MPKAMRLLPILLTPLAVLAQPQEIPATVETHQTTVVATEVVTTPRETDHAGGLQEGTADEGKGAQQAGDPAIEAHVRERAKARWQALIRGDIEAAYAYLSPGYRSTTPLSLYHNRISGRAVAWKGAEVEAISCGAEVCKLTMKVTHAYFGRLTEATGQIGDSYLPERWILVEGEWWHVPKK